MYKITFINNTIFQGNSFDGSWQNIPKLPVKSFEYFFKSRSIKLENFDAYNHLITKASTLKKTKILYIYLMAKKGKKIIVFFYDIQRKKMLRYFAKEGEELKEPVYTKAGNLYAWIRIQKSTGWIIGQSGKEKITINEK